MPASICEIELQSGHIRVTDHTATLPAAADESELRPTMCLQCERDEAGDDEECDDEDVQNRVFNYERYTRHS